MGRPLRIEYPDAFYHITARGNERQNVFKNNRDQERFLEGKRDPGKKVNFRSGSDQANYMILYLKGFE